MEMVDAAVVALAGRRIDLPEAQVSRFPLENVQEVGRRICEALYKMHAVALVCSAACGADLVALEQAKQLGLRRRIVLPFAPEKFRETSVVDRPGDWGPLYDQQVAATAAAGDFSRSTALLAATPPTRLQTRRLFAKRKRLRVLRNRIGRTV